MFATVTLTACHTPGPAVATPPDPRTDAVRAAIEAVAAADPDVEVAVVVDESGGVRTALRPDLPMHAASTMKVPVMIEAFRQVADGRLAWDQPVPVENRFASLVDGAPFAIAEDADDALYASLGGTLPVRELVERAITTSSNLATNLLLQRVTADSVQATADRLGASGMRVRRGVEDLRAFEAGLNNETTAAALAALFVALRDGRAVSPEADAAMVEILARQAHNEMLPAGLPPGTRVAHKTGWITSIHHDGGIVAPPGRAPYVLVVLTRGAPDHGVSARLGADLARAVEGALATAR